MFGRILIMSKKPVIVKLYNFFFLINSENFTVVNYEYSEIFLRGQYFGLLNSGRFETPLWKVLKPKWSF